MKTIKIKEWVAALRSGEYRQGKGFLRNSDDEYCCLGVLCDLAGMQWQSTKIEAFRAEANDCYSTTGIPLDSINEQLRNMGLPPGSLAKQNDSGRSFEKIADHIESIASLDSVIKFPMES